MKKLLLSKISLCLYALLPLYFLVAPSPIHALWTVQDPIKFSKSIESCDKNNKLESTCFGFYQFANLLSNINAATNGLPRIDPSSNTYNYEGGAIQTLANFTETLYNIPPASSQQYIAHIGQNLGLVEPVYAQTIGSFAFNPMLKIWQMFRNIAYSIFVVLLLIVGFMIMFRKKIDPQTVVTIQNSIPRIAIALLLVTFSYAIVGFMLDLMVLLIRMISFVFSDAAGAGLGANRIKLGQIIAEENIFNLIWPINRSTALANIISRTLSFPGLELLPEAQDAMKLIGWITVTVVFSLAGFFIMFKIFFMLLTAYIGIIINLLLAPIRLLLVAIPGNNEASDWFKDLLSNILVFPVTFALIFLAGIFTVSTTGDTSIPDLQGKFTWEFNAGIIDPLTWAPPLFGSKWATAIGPLIAYGILFTIPAINKEIQKQLQIQPGPATEAAVGELKEGVGRMPLFGSLISRIT